MKTEVISRNPANIRLILIFSGWSTTPGFYKDLFAEGWDIMVVYDYSEPNLEISQFQKYSTIFILAWSLGVAAAETVSHILPKNKIAASFAVNGTCFPADDLFGIPEEIYDGTRDNLSVKNLRRFRMRMGAREFADLTFMLDTEREEKQAIERLQNELTILRNGSQERAIKWNRAYIGTEDRIFPPSNQTAAWEKDANKPQIIHLPEGHYISLQKIIREITPDHIHIGKRFSRAVSTYEGNATAQIHIAGKLASFLTEKISSSQINSLLEIGPGSGTLTRKIADIIKPRSATFVDLYPLTNLGLAEEEIYVTDDAEIWIETAPQKSFDIVVSASTIQWFANPGRFFQNVSRILKPGGIFLCSTFIQGNLAELDVMRPSPLLYRTGIEIAEMLEQNFSYFHTEEEDIKLEFDSPRGALLHLKNTGVGGGSKVNIHKLLTSLPKHPILTYKTFYIYATSPLSDDNH